MYHADLARELISLSQQVAVLNGLYCESAQLLAGKHPRMAGRWNSAGCTTPDEYGEADHLQLVLDQSMLEASAASSTYLYYWQRKDTDAYDHTLSEVLGNGLTNTYQHNAATGRPALIKTRDGSQTLRALGYTYDVHNNLTERNDIYLGIKDLWEYDHLDRVTANNITLSDNRHGPGNPDLQSRYEYRYNALGNIIFKTGIGDYRYNTNGAGPHAVSQANGLSYL